MPRTTIEKIESIQTQIQQLENERKRLMQQQKEADRKTRTKRLIERGAILESLIPGADKFNNDQIKAFLEKTVTTENACKILDSMTQQCGETAAAATPWAARNSVGADNGKSADTAQKEG